VLNRVLLEAVEEVVRGVRGGIADGGMAGTRVNVWMILGKEAELQAVRCVLGMKWTPNIIHAITTKPTESYNLQC